MIAVLDHTFFRIEVVAPFAVWDNGKTWKINPRAKTVALVDITMQKDKNRNPTVRFVKLKPTTTKLDKHLAKVIALLGRT